MGAKLVAGDEIRAPVGASAELALPDGSTLFVAENSRLAVSKLEFDAQEQTRLAAFLCSGTMAVAYFQFHFPQSFFPTVNNGIPAVLYCFLYLYFMFAGAGPWSIDALIAARSVGTTDRVGFR